MMIDGLVSLLSADATITSLVAGRIQPIPAPADDTDYPCIVFQSASYKEEYSDSGAAGIATERIIFDAMAMPTSSSGGFGLARSIAFAIRNVLTGFGPATLPDNTFVELIEV